MRAADRIRRIRPMELAELMRTAAATGATDIALGFPPGQPPGSVLDAAVEALTEGRHQYADPAGLPALREAIAAEFGRWRGIRVDPATEVTITCGATEGVFISLLTLTDPGDEVIVIEPFFEIYPGMVEAAGAVPRYVRLKQPGWRLDMAAVRAAVTDRTRAVILNSPHNPTGRAFGAPELTALVRMCHELGIACITDEVYERTMFDGARHVSAVQVARGRDTTIACGSLSKSLHISGWRIGYCVADQATTALLRVAHERTTVGTSHPLQVGAARFGEADTQRYATRMQWRRDHMVEALSAAGLEVQAPEGGWFVFAGTRALGWSSRTLARRLLAEAGVLVAPGTAFFSDPTEGENWVRVTFVKPEQDTVAALDRLTRFLRTRRPEPVAVPA